MVRLARALESRMARSSVFGAAAEGDVAGAEDGDGDVAGVVAGGAAGAGVVVVEGGGAVDAGEVEGLGGEVDGVDQGAAQGGEEGAASGAPVDLGLLVDAGGRVAAGSDRRAVEVGDLVDGEGRCRRGRRWPRRSSGWR
jgi:hypothetical protein